MWLASRGFVTEVIKPAETRKRLLAALNMLKNKQVAEVPKKHGNIHYKRWFEGTKNSNRSWCS